MADRDPQADERNFAVNMERFTGFADVYDAWRPQPPQRLAALLLQLAGAGAAETVVVDLGCGTGLSTRYWSGIAAEVIGVEPTDAMRARATARGGAGVRYVKGFSHATGLPACRAQIVTCSQALHWMEPQETFAEAARILKPGGVFAACDYDWPPVTGVWEVDAAYSEADARCRALEHDSHVSAGLRRWDKSGHLERMATSGAFRWTREILLHHGETGSAERLLGLFRSQGMVQQLLKAGYSEERLGITALQEVAHERLPRCDTDGTGNTRSADAPDASGTPDAAGAADTLNAPDTPGRRWLWCARVRVGVV